MTAPSLLLTGATGFLGSAALPALVHRHDVTAVRFRSPASGSAARWLRIAPDPEEAARLVTTLEPAAIVNAAALASLSACRRDPALAFRLNAELPAALAHAARATGSRLLHLSTDQVFDGRGGRYVEADQPSPISIYGESKLAGERAVLESLDDSVVLRVNLVCGRSPLRPGSSVDQLLARAQAGEDLPLFTDEYRSPVAVSDVVSAIAELVSGAFRGTLHLGGPRLSRHALGLAVLEKHGLSERVRPASLADYDGPPRARDTSFDSTLAREVLVAPPRGMEAILADC